VTTRLKTVGAGALYGIVAGACAALAVMRLVPSVGHPVTLRQLPWDFGWAVFYSWPIGPLVGALAGAFLYWRGQRVASFRRLLLETSALAAASVAALVQAALPVAWELPRMRITLIGAFGAAVLAAVGTLILRPMYWPTRPPSS
jgi:hypothetical protein